MAAAHPDCEVVAICDENTESMREAQHDLRLADRQLFSDWQTCIQQCQPDLLILCPSTGDHAVWIERLAPLQIPILLEKPMAATLEEADRMIEICQQHSTLFAINWPLVWVPSHRTAKRLIDEGVIGQVREVHYYDGNRGPLWHSAGKAKRTSEEVTREKPGSWFYQRESGGGSLRDYLGYGVTLGTWFLNGATPIDVTCVCDKPENLEVDEHSVTIARYDFGLSKFETRWGTFTDPWTHQPQPKCGFVLVGSEGTISTYDYESTIRVQDRTSPKGREQPVDTLDPPSQNPVQYLVQLLQSGTRLEGPLTPGMSRIGQQIVETAIQSAEQGRTLPLIQ